MLEFMNENHQGLTVVIVIVTSVINIGTSIVYGIFSYCSYIRSSRLEKEVEEYKHQLEKKLIKNELQITQTFKVYNELLTKIKLSEGELFKLFGNVQRQRPITKADNDACWLSCMDARNFFYINSLVISDEVNLLAEETFKAFETFASSNNSEHEKNFAALKDMIKKLEVQMKKEIRKD